MSANNQTLVKEFEGKWYVFPNVQAESWCDENMEHVNELSISEGVGPFDTRDEAFSKALELDENDDCGGTEYGVQFNRLCKDDSEVIILKVPPTQEAETNKLN